MGTKKGWSKLLSLDFKYVSKGDIYKENGSRGWKKQTSCGNMSAKKGAKGWKRVEKYHVINLYFLDCGCHR